LLLRLLWLSIKVEIMLGHLGSNQKLTAPTRALSLLWDVSTELLSQAPFTNVCAPALMLGGVSGRQRT
jgi:hypothetical protein